MSILKVPVIYAFTLPLPLSSLVTGLVQCPRPVDLMLGQCFVLSTGRLAIENPDLIGLNKKGQNIENEQILTFLNQGPQILMRAPKLLRLGARLAPNKRNFIFTPAQGKWPKIIPVRENTENLEILPEHREFCLLKL